MKIHRKTFSRMRSEGFLFSFCGSGGGGLFVSRFRFAVL